MRFNMFQSRASITKRLISYSTQTRNQTSSLQPQPNRLDDLLRLGPVLFDPLRIPRHPIVLCHGLYGFSVRGPTSFPRFQIHYWGKLLEILRDRLGIKVIIGHVPSTGSIKRRAISLDEMLRRSDLNLKNSDLNFLAHSMGGLDARYLISHLGHHQPHYHPVSLTTICTPHRGSPFMDWCRANIGVGKIDSDDQFHTSTTHDPSTPKPNSNTKSSSNFNYLPNNLLKVLLLNLLDSPAYSNLSTDFLIHKFNPRTPDHPGVKYFSVAGRMCRKKVNKIHPLWLPTMVLDEYENRISDEKTIKGHDGLVTVESARWGEFLGVVDGTDHWEIRGSSAFGHSISSSKSSSGQDRHKSGKTVSMDEMIDQQTKSSWQEVNRLVGNWFNLNPTTQHTNTDNLAWDNLNRSSEIRQMTEEFRDLENELDSKPSTDLSAYVGQEPSKSSLFALADWLARRLPNHNRPTQNDDQESDVKPSSHDDHLSTIEPGFPLDDVLLDQPTVSDHTRLLYGLSSSSSSSSSQLTSQTKKASEVDRFDLERFYTAICRNLYDHGF